MKRLRYLLLVSAGTALLALAVYAFAIPNDLIFGGATGLSLLIGEFTGLDIALITGILNVGFLGLGWFALGKKMVIGSVFSSLLYPVLLWIFEQIPALSEICTDPLLASIIGGACGGIGVGLVMSAGASTGGTDILCVVMHKLLHMSVGTALNLSDGLIMLAQLSFQPPMSILYGLIYTVAMSHMIDDVLALGSRKVKVTVVTQQYEKMRVALLKTDVGVTMYQIITGLDQKPGQSIVTVFKRKYFSKVQKVIHDTDPDAFFTAEDVNEVHGRGFTLERYTRDLSDV
jgi:uncharacterized membrane-anchored protein YitT (DUF2179 family)